MERRKFIKTTAASGLAITTAPTILTGSRWKGANDRVNVAQIGIRGMGQAHIKEYQKKVKDFYCMMIGWGMFIVAIL